MKCHNRKSTRLKGFDYSRPGGYFITMVTAQRSRVFGRVVEGRMQLSEIGRIVESCWKQIPLHFPNTSVEIFQIMPDHMHGIVEIRESGISAGKEIAITRGSLMPSIDDPPVDLPVVTRHVVSQLGFTREIFGKPRPGTLATIIRSFKSAVTKLVHDQGLMCGRTIWQPRYYDHIIRDDIDRFFIEEYIELNPVMWELNSENPGFRQLPPKELEKKLRTEFDLSGYALQKVIEHELHHRQSDR